MRLLDAPIVQATFLFGAVTVSVGVASVNGVLLTSPSNELPAGLTRTSPCVVTTDGVTAVYAPVPDVAAGTPDATGVQVEPLFALNSTSNVWAAPSEWFQVIVRVDPAAQLTAVFGAVTEIAEAHLGLRDVGRRTPATRHTT